MAANFVYMNGFQVQVYEGVPIELTVMGSFDRPPSAGGFNLVFDPAVLQLSSIVIDPSWNVGSSAGTIDNVAGSLTGVWFGTSTVLQTFVPFPIATLTFQTIATGSSPTSPLPNAANPFVDFSGQALAVTHQPSSAQVLPSPVPEPTALALLLTGLPFLVASTLKRRRADA